MLGIIPGAINTDSTSKVTFTSFVDDLAIAPVSVFLEEICKDGNVIDEFAYYSMTEMMLIYLRLIQYIAGSLILLLKAKGKGIHLFIY